MVDQTYFRWREEKRPGKPQATTGRDEKVERQSPTKKTFRYTSCFPVDTSEAYFVGQPRNTFDNMSKDES